VELDGDGLSPHAGLDHFVDQGFRRAVGGDPDIAQPTGPDGATCFRAACPDVCLRENGLERSSVG
jgi:hypothetical protein